MKIHLIKHINKGNNVGAYKNRSRMYIKHEQLNFNPLIMFKVNRHQNSNTLDCYAIQLLL